MDKTAKKIERIKKDVQARKAPQQERAKQTVARILTGAKDILEREGRKGLSARKLAKECGMSTGSIYDHFPSISAVLYALYEERLNQELEMYRKFYTQDLDELTMTEVVDLFVKQDATLEWGSALDLELEEAVKHDETLYQLQQHSLQLQRELLMGSLKRRNSDAQDSQLEVLASYMLGLSQLTFQLRNVDKLSDGQMVFDLGVDLAKYIANYPLAK